MIVESIEHYTIHYIHVYTLSISCFILFNMHKKDITPVNYSWSSESNLRNKIHQFQQTFNEYPTNKFLSWIGLSFQEISLNFFFLSYFSLHFYLVYESLSGMWMCVVVYIVLRPHTHWSGWDVGACVKIVALIFE